MGIYRDIRLVSTPAAVISYVTPQVTLNQQSEWEVRVAVYLQCKRNTRGRVVVSLEDLASATAELDCLQDGEQRVDVMMKVAEKAVNRWYPVGYGEHPTYTLTTVFEGEEMDQKEVQIGFRTADLITEKIGDDEESMYFRINGIDVFIRGR